MSMISAAKAATRLGVHRTTVARMIGRGELSAIRMPSGAIRIDAEELERWLASRQVAAPAAVAKEGAQ